MLIRLVLLQLGGTDIHERPDATLVMLARSVRFERFPCGNGFSVHQQSLQMAGDGLLSRFDSFLKSTAGRKTAWRIQYGDYGNDGDPDLLVTNPGTALSPVHNLPAGKDSVPLNSAVENPLESALPPDLAADLPLHRLGNPSVEAFPRALAPASAARWISGGIRSGIFPEYALSGVRPRASQARK